MKTYFLLYEISDRLPDLGSDVLSTLKIYLRSEIYDTIDSLNYLGCSMLKGKNLCHCPLWFLNFCIYFYMH